MPTEIKQGKTHPAKFVPQLLGGLGGAYASYSKQKKAAEASGEKLNFGDAIGGIAMGGLSGVINPASGIIGGVGAGIGDVANQVAENKAERVAGNEANNASQNVIAQNIANQNGIDASGNPQNSSVQPNPVFNPSGQNMIQSVTGPEETYGSLFT